MIDFINWHRRQGICKYITSVKRLYEKYEKEKNRKEFNDTFNRLFGMRKEINKQIKKEYQMNNEEFKIGDRVYNEKWGKNKYATVLGFNMERPDGYNTFYNMVVYLDRGGYLGVDILSDWKKLSSSPEDEYEVLIPLTAENILEKNPCEKGFKKFVEKWGKGHTHWNFGDGEVGFKTIGKKGLFITWAKEQIDINGKTYLDWFIEKGFIKRKEKEVRIKIGDKFKVVNDWYMLTFNDRIERKVFLKSLLDGGQWSEGFNVKDIMNITFSEFKEIVISDWVKRFSFLHLDVDKILATQNKAKINIEEI